MEKAPDEAVVPPRRSTALVVEHLGDETLIYDLERDEAHHLNPTAAAVFALCDGTRSRADMTALASERLGQPVSIEAVGETLEQLADRGLLSRPSETGPGVSRRQVVRKAAVLGGAAVAGPVIMSIVAPTPAIAQSQGTPATSHQRPTSVLSAPAQHKTFVMCLGRCARSSRAAAA